VIDPPEDLHVPRILDQIVRIYLGQQYEFDLGGANQAYILSVIQRLSSYCAGNLVIQRSFCVNVFFESGKVWSLIANHDDNDVMEFTPKQRRPVNPKDRLPSTVRFTGQITPLFVIQPNSQTNPRNIRLA